MIRIENLSKSYNGQIAVHKVGFDMAEGETVGFLGPNGAGKSTVLKILAGALVPDCGSVEMFGMDLDTCPVECKRRIGYLPEDNPLYGNMYVREYLEYAGGIYLPKQKLKHAVAEMIETCGLKNEYHKRIDSLSKGNRQRLGLAQALIHKPDFLILDEPTSGLDPNQQDEILSVIKSFSAGRHVLISTHSLTEAKDICSQIIIIHQGTIRLNEKADAIESMEQAFSRLTKDIISD